MMKPPVRKSAVPSETRADSGSKERILAAARAEFAQHGRAGARVDRIAERAQINKAMIYYHFHSKDNLYSEVIRWHFAEMMKRVQSRTKNVESIEARLRVVAEAHGDMAIKEREFRSVILRELANPSSEILDQIGEVFSASGLLDALRRDLESAMKRGDIRRMDVCQVGAAFVAMSLGYFVLAPIIDRIWKIDDRAAFIKDRKRAIVDLFINGLKASKP